jgi:hypothetical protein
LSCRHTVHGATGLGCLLLIIFGTSAGCSTQHEELPDWSGWWGINEPPPAEFARHPPPMRPADLETLRVAIREDLPGDPGRFCYPQEFVGYSGGFVESVEFLFTPGRVTLTNEGGMLRRIYTDVQTPPADLDDSRMGLSIGRWEGQTLVVETTGIDPEVRFPRRSQVGSIAIGRNARITERITLISRETLEFQITVEAPEILLEPDQRTRTYVRVPKQVHREISFCTDNDRSIDPLTGEQRFDMTPPADLPPPPP